MPKKFDRCVRAVMRSNKKKGKDYNPWAVCNKTVGRKKSNGL